SVKKAVTAKSQGRSIAQAISLKPMQLDEVAVHHAETPFAPRPDRKRGPLVAYSQGNLCCNPKLREAHGFQSVGFIYRSLRGFLDVRCWYRDRVQNIAHPVHR